MLLDQSRNDSVIAKKTFSRRKLSTASCTEKRQLYKVVRYTFSIDRSSINHDLVKAITIDRKEVSIYGSKEKGSKEGREEGR